MLHSVPRGSFGAAKSSPALGSLDWRRHAGEADEIGKRSELPYDVEAPARLTPAYCQCAHVSDEILRRHYAKEAMKALNLLFREIVWPCMGS